LGESGSVRRSGLSVVSDGGAFDVDVWDDPVEDAGEVPGAVAEEAHQCRDERHADEERVDEDAGGEREPDRFDDGVVGEDEPESRRLAMAA
jgi:hypothetical protein